MSEADTPKSSVARRVVITAEGQLVLDIETHHLAGAPMTPENETHVRWALRHLAGFLGLSAIEAAIRSNFQDRVQDWLIRCLGTKAAIDPTQRNHRFLEEALELVQARGCTESEALEMVRYVYSRPVGEVEQEIGGVMLSLAGLCAATSHNMTECGERELARVCGRMNEVRAKHKRKPIIAPGGERAARAVGS